MAEDQDIKGKEGVVKRAVRTCQFVPGAMFSTINL
jgi:hypothetical protein